MMDYLCMVFFVFLIIVCGYLKRILDRLHDLENRTPVVLTLPVSTENSPELKEHMEWVKAKIQKLDSKYGELNSRIKKVRRLVVR